MSFFGSRLDGQGWQCGSVAGNSDETAPLTRSPVETIHVVVRCQRSLVCPCCRSKSEIEHGCNRDHQWIAFWIVGARNSGYRARVEPPRSVGARISLAAVQHECPPVRRYSEAKRTSIEKQSFRAKDKTIRRQQRQLQQERLKENLTVCLRLFQHCQECSKIQSSSDDVTSFSALNDWRITSQGER